MNFGKVTRKLVKLATEDKNLLRYMFSGGAKVKAFELPNGNMEVILSGSARLEFQTALPRMLDANSGREAIFVDLLVDIGLTVSKAILTEIIATGAVYAAIAIFGLASGPIGVILGVIFVSIGVGIAVEYADRKLGISKSIQRWVNDTQSSIDYKIRKIVYLIESGAVYNKLTI